MCKLRPHDYRVRCVRTRDTFTWFTYSEFWQDWTPTAEANVMGCFNLVPLPHPTLDELKASAYSFVEYTLNGYLFFD